VATSGRAGSADTTLIGGYAGGNDIFVALYDANGNHLVAAVGRRRE
jgi:hypothetical protein